ncbi:MAG: hypothetical protein ACXADY_21685 [Candidatus Hodarchaeales archaeon]
MAGFQPDQVNLAEMKDEKVKLILIGDGMSGKTQILVTFGKLIMDYLQKIYLLSNEASENGLDDALLRKWSNQHDFSLRYGNIKWNVLTVSLDTETIGFEDFEYAFPYIWNGVTYKIKFSGNDVGGQNIFNHFRSVLGKIAGPNDNLVVVFDKSRELSCYNSMEQIKKVREGMISEKNVLQESNLSRMFFCGNKIDLLEHIQAQKWRDRVLQSLMSKILCTSDYGEGEYYLPSLIGDKEKERDIKYKIENNRITFPDLEAIIYLSIKESDSEYGKQMMGDINTKALAREIAAQLVFKQKIDELKNQKSQLDQIFENFCSLLFRDRPLAMQYSGGVREGPLEDDSAYFGRMRKKWGDFGATLPITKEIIDFSLTRATTADNLISKMTKFGNLFNTNALSGEGIIEMIDFIIQETLKKNEDPNSTQKIIPKKRKIKKF